jgi:hypothetical protein
MPWAKVAMAEPMPESAIPEGHMLDVAETEFERHAAKISASSITRIGK